MFLARSGHDRQHTVDEFGQLGGYLVDNEVCLNKNRDSPTMWYHLPRLDIGVRTVECLEAKASMFITPQLTVH